jgi:hypothetical protein
MRAEAWLRMRNGNVEDAFDASESVEDAAAECVGRGGAAPAAITFIISRSSQMPTRMQDNAMDRPTNPTKDVNILPRKDQSATRWIEFGGRAFKQGWVKNGRGEKSGGGTDVVPCSAQFNR